MFGNRSKVQSTDPETLVAMTQALFTAYSDHDIDQMISLCAPDMTLNYVPEGDNGKGDRETARGFWSTFTSLIPDFRVDVYRIMVGERFTVAETIQGGTPAQDIGPIKAKGGTTMAPHCYVIQFSNDGLISEITCYWDYNRIYAQLGHTEHHPELLES